jgi:meso-butanediol dehydrogenase / (S,S)-butanediol dehydrogenase / diacetyl reductase
MQRFEGKQVVVTGAGGGIGEAIVRRFLDEGAIVIALEYDEEACQRLRGDHPRLAGVIRVDVADERAVEAAFHEIDRRLGGLDILVNAAAMSLREDISSISANQWRRVVDTNLTGTFLASKYASGRLRYREGTAIVNVGSTSGIVGHPYFSAYDASKGGVVALTRSLALELQGNVRVVCVCPGVTLAPFDERSPSDALLDEHAWKIPLGRSGTPEDVAAVVAFAASSDAAFMTGQAIVVDGGETAGGLASR